MIRFYNPSDPFGELSNYYVLKNKITFNQKVYASSEHLYQSLKFQYKGASVETIAYAETIRLAKTPNIAKILARQAVGGGYAWRVALNPIISKSLQDKVQPNPDWDVVKDEKMKFVIKLKFTQDLHCKNILLSTKEASLAEHTTRDKYWADGGDKCDGKNMLGKLLMQQRDDLLHENGAAKKRKLDEIVTW